MRLLLTLLTLLAGPAAGATCRDMTFEDMPYTICEAHQGDDLRLFLNGPDGPYGGFAAIDAALADKGQSLAFAMNAGMFQPDLSPVGLYVEDGKQVTRLDHLGWPGQFRPAAQWRVLHRRNDSPSSKAAALRPKNPTAAMPPNPAPCW